MSIFIYSTIYIFDISVLCYGARYSPLCWRPCLCVSDEMRGDESVTGSFAAVPETSWSIGSVHYSIHITPSQHTTPNLRRILAHSPTAAHARASRLLIMRTLARRVSILNSGGGVAWCLLGPTIWPRGVWIDVGTNRSPGNAIAFINHAEN
jgi:hypothetical protein